VNKQNAAQNLAPPTSARDLSQKLQVASKPNIHGNGVRERIKLQTKFDDNNSHGKTTAEKLLSNRSFRDRLKQKGNESKEETRSTFRDRLKLKTNAEKRPNYRDQLKVGPSGEKRGSFLDRLKRSRTPETGSLRDRLKRSKTPEVNNSFRERLKARARSRENSPAKSNAWESNVTVDDHPLRSDPNDSAKIAEENSDMQRTKFPSIGMAFRNRLKKIK